MMKGSYATLKRLFLITLITGLSSIGLTQSDVQQVKKFKAQSLDQTIQVSSPTINYHVVQKKSTPKHSTPQSSNASNAGFCASDKLMNAYLMKNGLKQQYEAAYQEMVQNINYSGVTNKVHYTIPIIFHVVWNSTAQKVPYSAIMNIFNELNEDYQLQNSDRANARSAYSFSPANADISFCLAVRDPQNNPLAQPGVEYVYTNQTRFYANSNSSTNGSNAMKTSAHGAKSWDHTKYLNVWICDISGGKGYGVAGYAYLPSQYNIPPASVDGVVADYDMGMQLSTRVLTHEVGHYLGLPHTWGNTDGAGCTNGNDGINDTPNTKGPSFDYPGSCSGNQETCPGTQTQYENFMDYSNCTVMFTNGQVAVMKNILATSRNSLTSSNACTPLNNQPPNTDFQADITTVVSGGVVNFTDLSTNYPTTWNWTITPSAGWSYIGGTSATTQNPKVQFNTAGDYTVKLTASNNSGSNSETKTNYIHVIASGGGATSCDTMRNYNPNDNFYSIGNASTGFLLGHNHIQDQASNTYPIDVWVEPYTITGSKPLRSVRFLPSKVINNSGNAKITIQIYDDNSGVPGTVIAQKDVSFNNIEEKRWNIVPFNSAVTVSGKIYVGYKIYYLSPQDSFALYGTLPTTNYTFMHIGGTANQWEEVGNVFSSGGNPLNTAFVFDLLFSNGPAPIANYSISANEACANSNINVNGFASTNTNRYVWYFENGSTRYKGIGGDLTFNNLPVGTWNVEFHAQGSCVEDVATTTLIIDPSIAQTLTHQDENCGKSDGSIEVKNISGGQGGPYKVSTNNGATFKTSAPYLFNNLSAGNYITIIKDAICSDTVKVVIANINNFNPSLSPGTNPTINYGDNITLSVSGGTTWVWYEQGATSSTTISTDQSVNVQPDTTTTYTVEVTNSSGCSKTLTITVNVDGSATIGASKIKNNISIYPNPSRGVFNLAAHFAKSQEVTIQVYSLVGQMIKEKHYSKTKEINYPLNLSHMDNGAYIIRVKGEFGTFTQRIILSK